MGNPVENQQSSAQPKRLVARLAVPWPGGMEKYGFSASPRLNLEGGGGAKLKKCYFVFRAATSTPGPICGAHKILRRAGEALHLTQTVLETYAKPHTKPDAHRHSGKPSKK